MDDALTRLRDASFELIRQHSWLSFMLCNKPELPDDVKKLLPPDTPQRLQQLRNNRIAAFESFDYAYQELREALVPYRDSLASMHVPFPEVTVAGVTASSYCEVLERLACNRLVFLSFSAGCATGGKCNVLSSLEGDDFDRAWEFCRGGTGISPEDRSKIENGVRQEVRLLDHPPSDDEAYVSAKQLRDAKGLNATECKRFVKKHEIRHRNPKPNRLEIHAGDWFKCWEQLDRAEFEATDEIAAEFVAGVNRRQAEIRAKKAKR